MFRSIDTAALVATVQEVSKSVLNTEIQLTQWGRNTIKGVLPFTVGEGEFQPSFYLLNRNDGHTALRFSLGANRIVCMNGLIVPGFGITKRVIHREGSPLQQFESSFASEVREVLTLLGNEDFQDFKQSLSEIVLSESDGVNLIGLLPMHSKAKELSFKFWLNNASRRAEDQGYTAWQLYNLVNEFDRKASKGDAAFAREMTRVEDIFALTQPSWEVVNG